MQYYGLSDIGLIRDKNQDSILFIENKYGDFLGLVADGIGGGPAGEVASSKLIKYFEDSFKVSGPFTNLEDAKSFLEFHFDRGNDDVYKLAKSEQKYNGMGTTLTGLMIVKDGVLSINCGDSRVYGFKDNKIIVLTEDHSLVNEMLKKGKITYEESLNHPQKHFLTRAVGIFNIMNVDVNKVDKMDYYLVCSDGLHGYVSEEIILNTIYDESLNIEEKASFLKNKALESGGYDNISIVIVKM